MSFAPSQVWDLDSLFSGGLAAPAFVEALATLRVEADTLVHRAEALSTPSVDLRRLILELVELDSRSQELSNFAHCQQAADTTSVEPRRAVAAAMEVESLLERVFVSVVQILGEAEPSDRSDFLDHPELVDAREWLDHACEGHRFQLDRPLQELMVQLDREALHGWGQLYDQVAGTLRATLEIPGQPPREMSISALAALRSSPDPTTRRAVFTASNEAWSTAADACALALTHITGARQTRFDRVGVDEIAPSLHRNRVQRSTLDAIWAAAEAMQSDLVRYLDRKARILGKTKLDWWDLFAPLPGAEEASLTWEAAQELVVGAFHEFSSDMGAFAEHALRNRWVESRHRDGKQQGAFCIGFQRRAESRVFMTWSDGLDLTLTLAHELGHAYHNHVLFEQPFPRQHLTSALAETASTFAEAIVRHAATTRAGSSRVRVFMLEQQLQAGAAFLMNIPARFAFERRLFELRREGVFDPATLSAAMMEAQQTAYRGALASWDPLFWASKLHFYISQFGFYNWPYTFGYLFSSAAYARARKEGSAFAPSYVELLRQTGFRPSEAIARDVLGGDMSDPEFWYGAMAPLRADLSAFLAETDTSS